MFRLLRETAINVEYQGWYAIFYNQSRRLSTERQDQFCQSSL